MDSRELSNRFTYHPPSGNKVTLHEAIRTLCTELAVNLDHLLTDGREKSVAITKLEEVMFWSNASIAREGN